ncbi:hypothetical protein SCP_0702610 [Sparassis crispa]|uniref:Uncharacterized protein n=1 Tax=Sparassis crispa TaxID=139825 RepID=A0A401GS75_9APHY|nr:hypothetical protein SCP_0702610 [Sparassis crispa]GBE85075.1 hypothetical protein SCP_0702610 [Sparassis crispa]
MALTATAQSALPHSRGPVWNEVIVPTLRKRLKDESKILAKRISAASIGSGDDHSSDYQSSAFSTPPTQFSQYQRPSAIPRPSLQHSRNGTDSSQATPSPPQTFHRARTYSQPYLFDESGVLLPEPTPSRSNSPMINGTTTRIPVSRGRAGSSSSHAHGSTHGSIGRPEGSGHTYIESSDLYPVDESLHTHSTRSTVRIPPAQGSRLFREHAPFGSVRSIDYDPPRLSSDSEERPFEHWYRGDVSRNGGVGELRVGRREEMLDIASYGHTFRNASSRAALSSYSRSRSNSRGRDTESHTGMRSRAEGVGATTRESFYLDEDEHTQDMDMVLDEQPLTDLESDGYADQEEVLDLYSEQDVLPHPNGTVSSPSLTLSNDISGHRYAQQSVSRIPMPSTRHISPPPRTPTPTQAMRSMSEASTSSATSTPRSEQPSRMQPSPQSQTPVKSAPSTAKRRAKSPATPGSATSSKKPKTKPPPSSMQKKLQLKEEYRRSVGVYPAPDGDNVVDAIPSWTQPVPSGNWDDVVLPVVARKKGLDGHYATADGNPRPKPKLAVYEPAPGTFGYDHSKYRPPNANMAPQDIPMDEFGQKKEVESVLNPEPTHQPSLAPKPSPEPDRARLRPSPPPSPPPFSHYAENNDETTLHVTQFPSPPRRKAKDGRADDDGGAGCCRCIVM